MKHVKFFVFVLIVSLVMALFEVQIEGARGWAANLPTWRIHTTFSVFGMWGTGEKPLTGYHIYLWLYLLALCHTPLLFTKWNWKLEFKVLALYSFISTFEGILWFVVNPAWGLLRFKPGISWYREIWFLGLPAEYYLRFAIGTVFYYLSERTPRIKKNKLIL